MIKTFEQYYEDPNSFESLENVNVSLTDGRKALLLGVKVDGKFVQTELTREQSEELIAGLEEAVSRMFKA